MLGLGVVCHSQAGENWTDSARDRVAVDAV